MYLVVVFVMKASQRLSCYRAANSSIVCEKLCAAVVHQRFVFVSRPRETRSPSTCFLVSAGMGVPTVTAARILKGQLSGQSGEETQLEMDKFPFVSLAKVCQLLS